MSHNHGIEETSIEALIEKQRRLACSGNRGRHGSALCDHHLRDCGIGASLVVKRVKSGMRRARLEGRQIGRARLDVDREQVVIDDRSGLSLTQVANKHRISRASFCRLVKEANDRSTPPFSFLLLKWRSELEPDNDARNTRDTNQSLCR